MWIIKTDHIVEATGYGRLKVRDDIVNGRLDPRDLVDLSRYVMGAFLSAKRVTTGVPYTPPAVKPAKKEANLDYTESQEEQTEPPSPPPPRNDKVGRLASMLNLKRGSELPVKPIF